MAYDHHYRLASENSVLCLASSHSCLDGVPFKISPAFRPAPQPQLGVADLAPTEQCAALHEEYEYDTEEAVLAWARAREEAKAKAIAEREAAERARAAVAAAESDSSSDSDVEVDTAQPSSTAVTTTTATTDGALPSESAPQLVKPPWQLPLAAASSSTILTPMPIQAGNSKAAQSPLTPKAKVDLALFEQEGDPFDNLELQTLNDMEELRTLLGASNLGGAATDTSQDPSPNPDSQRSGDVEPVLGNVNGNNAWQSDAMAVDDSSNNELYVNIVPGSSTVAMGNVSSRAMAQSEAGVCVSGAGSEGQADAGSNLGRTAGYVIEGKGDGDYVQLRPDYSNQAVSFQRGSSPIYGNVGPGAESGLTDQLPDRYANSKMVKEVLPPIRPRGQSLDGGQGFAGAAENTATSLVNSVSSVAATSQNNFVSEAGGQFGLSSSSSANEQRMSQSAYVMSASASGVLEAPRSNFSDFSAQNHTYSNLPASQPAPSGQPLASGCSPAFSNNLYSRYANCGSSSAGPMSTTSGSDRERLRSARSNPDLSSSSSRSPHLPPQYSPQPWNPYKPLPPTPVSELRSSSSSTESLPNDHPHPFSHAPSTPTTITTATSSQAASSSSQPELDPYNSLPSEAKTFVNNLTSMGFSRSRASRAVQKFGADEREVLDHLFNVDKLVEKKFTPALAETGLQLFKNDIGKAEQFLDLYQQFTELGFTGDRIQTALVKHQLDRDKALDYLTA